MVKQNFASMLPDIIFQDRSSRYNDVWYVKKIIAQNSFCRWIVWSNWTSKCDLKKCKKKYSEKLPMIRTNNQMIQTTTVKVDGKEEELEGQMFCLNFCYSEQMDRESQLL